MFAVLETIKSGLLRSPARFREGLHPSEVAGLISACQLLIFIAAVCALAAVSLTIPATPALGIYLGTVGAVAMWRYAWWLTHVVRATRYLRKTFPALRTAATNRALPRFSHVYAIVMSYDINPRHFFEVYKALINNAATYGAQTTIVASVTSQEDCVRLDMIHRACGSPSNVEILTQFQDGSGKRRAMAEALRAIRRRNPTSDSPVIFMDGDIMLERRAFEGTLSILSLRPDVSAVTTNNDAIVHGKRLTREWYKLRYAQRHLIMASLSLSERLLVLTGRFSVIRAEDAVDPEMIALIEEDGVDHWRHGRIKFLSGDDKSTWQFLLQRSRKMLYVPDVTAAGFETLPNNQGFLTGSSTLMCRWFGNMLRANGRALAVSPRKTGAFVWWTLLDQRLSMWTTLIGPTATALFALTVSPVYIAYYLLWTCLSRSTMSLVAGAAWGRWRPTWPLLMYYNQIWGAALKVFLLFRLDRQSWSRQGIRVRADGGRINTFATGVLTFACVAAFVFIVAVQTSVLNASGITQLISLPLAMETLR